MKTTTVMPVALAAALAGVLGSRVDASRSVPPAAAASPSCPALSPASGRRFDAVILRHSRKRGLNPRLVKAIIATESQFTPRAVSHSGARGLMQVMPATAKEFGVGARDLSDPETNISVGTEYLARLFKTARRRYGGKGVERTRVVRRVVAAYHSGPGALDSAAWSEPTRLYVRKVLSCYGSTASAIRISKKKKTVVPLISASGKWRGRAW